MMTKCIREEEDYPKFSHRLYANLRVVPEASSGLPLKGPDGLVTAALPSQR